MQGFETIGTNFRKMSEQSITTIVRGDKTKIFCVVGKFNGTRFYNALLVSIKGNRIAKNMIIKE